MTKIQTQKKSETSLKILTYNIHKGFGFRPTNFVLPRIREILNTVNADIVFLQEVQGHHESLSKSVESWPTESQFEYLADTLWPHFSYGKNAVYLDGHHGNAILSKHALLSWENIDISNNRLERRGLLHAVIQLEKCEFPLHVICMHLDLFESGRTTQIERLCERVQNAVPSNCPLIVAGDSNDWRQQIGRTLQARLQLTEVHKALHGRYAKTFPSLLPLLTLDRIYVRGIEISNAKCLKGAPWNELSDHAALFAEVFV